MMKDQIFVREKPFHERSTFWSGKRFQIETGNRLRLLYVANGFNSFRW